MLKRRLLKRLFELNSEKKIPGFRLDIADEIALDIQDILNTQRGNALIDSSMGMPDMKALFQSHSDIDKDRIAMDISEQIRRFEHRVKSHTIDFDERDSHSARLSWLVNAGLNSTESITINLRLLITEDGRISVKQLA